MLGKHTALMIAVSVVVATTVLRPVFAQEEHIRREVEQAETIAATKKAGDFVIAPIPILNPTIGIGLAAGAAYLYQIDEGSYPSFTGGGGLYTDNGSKAFGVAQSANFKHNTWKMVGGVFSYDLELKFYGIGSGAGDDDRYLPVNQQGWAAGAKVLRRIKGHWYGGASYFYLEVDSTFDLGEVPPDHPVEPTSEAEGASAIATLGLVAEYDSRDNQFSASSGVLFNASFSTSSEAVGSDFDFSSIHLAYNRYWSLSKDLVLAARGSGCAVPGDAPYYALCKFGVFPDLRGYVGGRYRDETMLAVQAEIRWHFSKRFSATGFAGVGEVAESVSDFDLDHLLPSIGAGLRYILSVDNRLNIGIDYAVGKGSDAVYFFVGE
ncbi:MAG: BamA/TamA family outer membrane protein, partial [bacterium]|nr:BamA/TamA family outer membrane protein [bacterium]